LAPLNCYNKAIFPAKFAFTDIPFAGRQEMCR